MTEYKNTRQLSWNEVVKLRDRYEDPRSEATVRSLAAEYGISKSAMHKILTYETYKEPLKDDDSNVR